VNASRVNLWTAPALGWIGLIFLSSTSAAGQWSEKAFQLLSRLLFSHVMRAGDSVYRFTHLVADKGFHVFLFAVLGVLLWNAVPKGQRKTISILIAGATVGSTSEFLQSLFPGRDPATRDVLINIAGTALGIALITWFSDWRRKRSDTI
jgi:VanZ family protein